MAMKRTRKPRKRRLKPLRQRGARTPEQALESAFNWLVTRHPNHDWRLALYNTESCETSAMGTGSLIGSRAR